MKYPFLLLLLSATYGLAQPSVMAVHDQPLTCTDPAGTVTDSREDIGRTVRHVGQPELHHYAPVPRADRKTAVLVIPGGGYTMEAWELEGSDIAAYLTHRGYHGFVLRHRLPAHLPEDCRSEGAYDDAATALQKIRGLADSLGFAADRVGVMGFSAGGHLAGSVSVHHRTDGGISSRPDFSVLVYPVLIMNTEAGGHAGSQRSLLGTDPDPAALAHYDLPSQVDSLTPPTLLVHASDDRAVPAENSLRYYRSLLTAGVEADLRVYAEGGHGFGAAREASGPVKGWLEEVVAWIEAQ